MNLPELGEAVPEDRSPKDRRMVVTAAISALVHLLILAILFLPRLALLPPVAPEAIAVDIVTSRDLASLESMASSAEVSSQAPSSDASSDAPSRAPAPSPSGGSPSSSPSAVPPPPPKSGSSAAPTSAQSSAEPPSGALSSARLVIPVGSAESSSAAESSGETSDDAASSEVSEETASSEAETASSASADTAPSALAATGGTTGGLTPAPDNETAGSASASQPIAAKPPKPVGGGALHAAKAFYLQEMLHAPGLAQAKATLKKLNPERRLAQTCNIEAYGQVGHAGYQPDAIIANAFAPVATEASTYSVTGGAFRSEGNWYRIAYQCTLKPDMSDVVGFSFHIGGDVTAEMTARLSGGGG
jgi:uncharacterized protein DUF930